MQSRRERERERESEREIERKTETNGERERKDRKGVKVKDKQGERKRERDGETEKERSNRKIIKSLSNFLSYVSHNISGLKNKKGIKMCENVLKIQKKVIVTNLNRHILMQTI